DPLVTGVQTCALPIYWLGETRSTSLGGGSSMWLVLTAIRRPITIIVAVIAIALTSIMAIRQMKVDIFPKLGAPAIYVAQPYGGRSEERRVGERMKRGV